MAKRAPQPRRPARSNDDDADTGMTNFSDAGGEEEEDDEDEEEDDAEEDRGDEHDPDGEDDDDGEDDGEEEEDPDGEDDDGEEDDEDDGEEEDEEEDPNDADLEDIATPGSRVPIGRLNQVLEQNRKLTEMVMALSGGKGPAAKADDTPAFDVKAKIKERNALLLEGKEEEATAIDLEIEEHRTTEANARAVQTVQASLQQQSTAAAIAEVQKTYPVLNDQSRKFNQDTLDEVVALRNVYMARGEPMATAIAKAARRICGRGKVVEQEGERRGKRGRDPEQLTQREKRVQMLRARRQPAATHRAGASARSVGSPGSRGDNLTEREVRGMSEREKREARGDFDVGGSRRKRR